MIVQTQFLSGRYEFKNCVGTSALGARINDLPTRVYNRMSYLLYNTTHDARLQRIEQKNPLSGEQTEGIKNLHDFSPMNSINLTIFINASNLHTYQ